MGSATLTMRESHWAGGQLSNLFPRFPRMFWNDLICITAFLFWLSNTFVMALFESAIFSSAFPDFPVAQNQISAWLFCRPSLMLEFQWISSWQGWMWLVASNRSQLWIQNWCDRLIQVSVILCWGQLDVSISLSNVRYKDSVDSVDSVDSWEC